MREFVFGSLLVVMSDARRAAEFLRDTGVEILDPHAPCEMLQAGSSILLAPRLYWVQTYCAGVEVSY